MGLPKIRLEGDPAPDEPGSYKPVEERCASRLRKSEERFGHVRYCTRPPLEGRNRCQFHGGKNPRGVAHPQYKHGRHSRYARLAPKRFREFMEAAQEDARDPASLVAEIDMLKGRAMQLFSEVWEGLNLDKLQEIDGDLDRVKTTLERIMADDLDPNELAIAELHEQVEEIHDVVMGAHLSHNTWDKLNNTLEQLRKLTSTETQRAYTRSKTISQDDQREMLLHLLRAIDDEFGEDEVFTRITGKEIRNRLRQAIQDVFFEGKVPAPVRVAED